MPAPAAAPPRPPPRSVPCPDARRLHDLASDCRYPLIMPAALTTRPHERSLFDAPQTAPREPESGAAPASSDALASSDAFTSPGTTATTEPMSRPDSAADSSADASPTPEPQAIAQEQPSSRPALTDPDAADLDSTDIEPPAPSAPQPTTIAAAAPARRGPLIDAGWLFLISGVALISFTVIIPAYNDLQDARFYRERMRLAEDHRELRLSRYQEYQSALNRADDTLVRSLAAMQLNQAPADQELIKSEGDIATRTASPFGSLEPPPLVLPEKVDPPKSTLEKWATDDRSRLWLLAAGALLILVGMLPAARRS